jgi:hypothetical protein
VRRTLGTAVVMACLLALPLVASASHQTMVLPTLLGEYHLTYDNRKVSEADLKPLVILSHHLAGWNSIAVTPRLERCVVGETEYLDCRDRSVRSPTFLWNARVNLKRGVATLDSLRAMRRRPSRSGRHLAAVLARLQPVAGETKLEFYQTGDVNCCDAATASWIRRARVGTDAGRARRRRQQRAVRHAGAPWHNCVNDLFRRRLGDYPIAAWQRLQVGHPGALRGATAAGLGALALADSFQNEALALGQGFGPRGPDRCLQLLECGVRVREVARRGFLIAAAVRRLGHRQVDRSAHEHGATGVSQGQRAGELTLGLLEIAAGLCQLRLQRVGLDPGRRERDAAHDLGPARQQGVSPA